eukprot:CAMPEP_0195142228 /NCGR_PEP_ID=MMETSP0448-20130528/164269_1 /TAXON_ID=66468 /ORGANISM="Heterocapsa triquestra, Strain CCMP 448" /LENGTH=43 /DNA_ID= /DNA_START= /DNA_END= /DNA_ORIENTATION=
MSAARCLSPPMAHCPPTSGSHAQSSGTAGSCIILRQPDHVDDL